MTGSTRGIGLAGLLETWGAGPGQSKVSGDPPFDEQLGEAIGRALEQFGIDPESVRVSIHRIPGMTQGRKNGGGAQPRQISVTVSPAPGASEAMPATPQALPEASEGWSTELLTGDLTAEQLRSVKHPSALLRARLALVRRSTPAYYLNLIDGSRIPSDPGHLSTREDAEAMLARLRKLGLSGGEVREVIGQTPFSRLEFAGDSRRDFYIGNLNVGLLLERYAKYPKEMADEMTKAELPDAAVPRSA